MRTTIVLDDELLEKAQALTHVQEKSALVKEVLKIRLCFILLMAMMNITVVII